MLENENFKVHLNEFNEIIDQLCSVDVKQDNKVQVLLLLD